MSGMQTPILGGVAEYGILLAITKYGDNMKNVVQISDSKLVNKLFDGKDWNYIGKQIDKWAFVISLTFMILFNIIYWTVVSSL